MTKPLDKITAFLWSVVQLIGLCIFTPIAIMGFVVFVVGWVTAIVGGTVVFFALMAAGKITEGK